MAKKLKLHNDNYYAPFEKALNRVLTPVEEYLHKESTSGVLLMLATILALVCANTALSEWYGHILHAKVTLSFGEIKISHSVHHWINDLLMAVFFFVVGLEIKREVLVGELSNLKAASLPILAAIGGMVFPALIYVFVAGDTPGAEKGWGVPMATDIAFAVGVMVLLGDRIPRSLVTFLLALAIADDLGAVAVIALFYTENLNLLALGYAGVVMVGLIGLNVFGVRSVALWVILALALWLAVSASGIHATVAGVLSAWAIPARPKVKAHAFSEGFRELLNKFDSHYTGNKTLINNEPQRAIVQTMNGAISKVQSPLQRLEFAFHPIVAFGILPLFAFANAGIPIALDTLMPTLTSPTSLGVMLGLIAGKVIGISGVAVLAAKLGIAELPKGCRPAHMLGVGLMGAIGFTMSIFIAELGFRGAPEQLVLAKTGILFASLLAGVLGYIWFFVISSKKQ